MKKGTGMDEKGTARERNPILPSRQMKLFMFAATALMGMFVMQIATYCAINDFEKRRLFLRDCGNHCPNYKPPVSTMFVPSHGREKENERKFETSTTQKGNTNSVPCAKKSILIIGGSDGSGTRAIVEVLRELGTIIVSEDPQTFDVAAEEVFHSSVEGYVTRGWPSLVERFVSSFGREGLFELVPSRKAGGNSETFCWPPPNQAQRQSDVANRLQADVSKLMVHWNDLYSNRTVNNQALQARISARYVEYGIKAPASMLVLPMFAYMQQQQESQPRLKFLHVLRDGRDVALSDNQSPVIKFYNLTYPPNHSRRESLASFVSSGLGEPPDNNSVTHAKAMQLWNDWNMNVYRWANDSKHSGIDIDYMWIRSEDLLVPESPERLDALTALARFAGSTITPEELCALCRKDIMDYGHSVRTASRSIFHSRLGADEVDILSKWELQNAEKQKQEQPGRRRLMEEKQMGRFGLAKTNRSVQSRYGKWKTLLENKPRLRDFFYEEGGEGLDLFGYHPHRQIRYTDSDLSTTWCGDSIGD